jgi:hypothetical protein
MDMAEILKEVINQDASDLHLAVGVPPMVRVDGHLLGMDYPVLSPTEARELIYSILSQDQRQKLETDWEIDFSYSLFGLGRFRVNAYFQRGTLGAAFRLVPVGIKTVEELGLPKVVHSFCHKPRGFILVTGPTGSGKSTTLASIIDEINQKRADHIVTIEDPIEFLHHHKRCVVNQREVGTDTKAFTAALRSALRQDPDIILIRDGTPGLRYAPYSRLPADYRQDDRCVPAPSTVADPGADRRDPGGSAHPTTAAEGQREWEGGCVRGAYLDAGRSEPDQRRENPPAVHGHADWGPVGDADDELFFGRLSPPWSDHEGVGNAELVRAGGSGASPSYGRGLRAAGASAFAV